jgi:nucleotide-binding universal stress UspA family protein
MSEHTLISDQTGPRSSDTILICYDGSEHARRAIDAAGRILLSRRALVLNVGQTLTPAESLALMTPATLDCDHVNAASAKEVAEQGVKYARQAGFAPEAKGGVASPVWEAIGNYAEEIDAALIVLGSRALSALGELTKHGVSHKVAQHAGRPVLIVPPPRRRAATVA